MEQGAIFESAPVGIFRIGTDGGLIQVNEFMAKICGYESADQLIGEAADLGRQVFIDRRRWREIIGQLPVTGLQCGIESEIRIRNGEKRWVQMTLWAVQEGAKVVYYGGTAEDISFWKTTEARIKQLAYRDSVTGLPNRSWFEERLSQAIRDARLQGGHVALLLLEVSRFHGIEDSYGKAVVDDLLREIAERIRRVVEESVPAARLEGAKFAILLGNARRARNVRRIANQIMSALRAQFTYFGHSVQLSPAMGVSIFPKDGQDEHALTTRANLAMYAARDLECDAIQYFHREMESSFRERVKIETDLMLALERDEFKLVYQPQADTRTGGISGVEALLRWQHPELGVLQPNDFIEVAESSGSIVAIGEWVLRTACLQARRWQDAGLAAVPVAVNISAIQLRDPRFCALVRRVIEESQLDPRYLELELTEGTLFNDAGTLAVLQELREIGVKLAIDDFGTGYSSFNYLRQFKVNRLKIDRAFVREVPENEDDAAITTAILNMARALHLDVLAEGVENARQLDFLRMHNCDSVQGFYISNPVAAEHIQEKFQNALIQCA